MSFQLSPAACASDAAQHAVATLLSTQWGGSISSRLATIQQKDYSWIFTNTDEAAEPVVVGHVRLTPSVSTTNDIQGSAPCGVLTSVIVDPNLRGKGVGLLMMQAIEKEAIKQRYYQLHLWTYDAVEFYRKLGYSISEERRALNTMAFAFESVNRSTLNSLENLLARKLEAVQRASSPPAVVTNTIEDTDIPRPNGTGAKGNAIWMRKRICDEVPLERVAVSTVLATIRRAYCSASGNRFVDAFLHACVVSEHGSDATVKHVVQQHRLSCTGPNDESSQQMVAGELAESAPSSSAIVAHPYVPWSHQVGPSCGIQALRFAEHILFEMAPLSPLIRSANPRDITDESKQANDNVETTAETVICNKTLLQLAVDCEYTIDGDIYNINHMCALAQLLPRRTSTSTDKSVFADSFVQSASELSCAELCNLLLGSPANVQSSSSSSVNPALLIFPYDRDDTQSTPCCKGGVAAHYALICGFILLPDVTASSSAEHDNVHHTYAAPNTQANDQSEIYRIKAIPPTVDPARVLLVAMHGLSSKAIVAPYTYWVASNAQLHCATAKLSKGTDAPSLRGNFVVLRKK